ncbi:selenoprotein [Salix suchowensis]|nr:selenoprotein [Salix suchowensis]
MVMKSFFFLILWLFDSYAVKLKFWVQSWCLTLKCCTEAFDDSMSQITYFGAILEVCMRKLVLYPEIVGFIKEEKDQFPTFKVQYLFNSPPKLIMLDDRGQHKETIRAKIKNKKRVESKPFRMEAVGS